MSDQATEQLASAENTTINPHPETGVSYVNKETQDAEALHQAASELQGKITGHVAPVKNFGSLDHKQFEQTTQSVKVDPATIIPSDKKNPVSTTTRWFAEFIHGRRNKNAAR